MANNSNTHMGDFDPTVRSFVSSRSSSAIEHPHRSVDYPPLPEPMTGRKDPPIYRRYRSYVVEQPDGSFLFESAPSMLEDPSYAPTMLADQQSYAPSMIEGLAYAPSILADPQENDHNYRFDTPSNGMFAAPTQPPIKPARLGPVTRRAGKAKRKTWPDIQTCQNPDCSSDRITHTTRDCLAGVCRSGPYAGTIVACASCCYSGHLTPDCPKLRGLKPKDRIEHLKRLLRNNRRGKPRFATGQNFVLEEYLDPNDLHPLTPELALQIQLQTDEIDRKKREESVQEDRGVEGSGCSSESNGAAAQEGPDTETEATPVVPEKDQKDQADGKPSEGHVQPGGDGGGGGGGGDDGDDSEDDEGKEDDAENPDGSGEDTEPEDDEETVLQGSPEPEVQEEAIAVPVELVVDLLRHIGITHENLASVSLTALQRKDQGAQSVTFEEPSKPHFDLFKHLGITHEDQVPSVDLTAPPDVTLSEPDLAAHKRNLDDKVSVVVHVLEGQDVESETEVPTLKDINATVPPSLTVVEEFDAMMNAYNRRLEDVSPARAPSLTQSSTESDIIQDTMAALHRDGVDVGPFAPSPEIRPNQTRSLLPSSGPVQTWIENGNNNRDERGLGRRRFGGYEHQTIAIETRDNLKNRPSSIEMGPVVPEFTAPIRIEPVRDDSYGRPNLFEPPSPMSGRSRIPESVYEEPVVDPDLDRSQEPMVYHWRHRVGVAGPEDGMLSAQDSTLPDVSGWKIKSNAPSYVEEARSFTRPPTNPINSMGWEIKSNAPVYARATPSDPMVVSADDEDDLESVTGDIVPERLPLRQYNYDLPTPHPRIANQVPGFVSRGHNLPPARRRQPFQPLQPKTVGGVPFVDG